MPRGNTHLFKIDRGEDWSRTITWREPPSDPEVPLSGAPIDLTGYSSTFTVWRLDKSVLNTNVPALGGAAGTIELQLSDTLTSDMSGYYTYKVFVTLAGTTTVVLQGTIEVE